MDGNTNVLAKEIATLINQLRKDPKGFAAHVKKRLETYDGVNFTDSSGVKYRSMEGKDACNEALVSVEYILPRLDLSIWRIK